MVTRKGVMIKTHPTQQGRERKIIPIFMVLMISFSVVSADPSGSPEVENSV